MEMLTCPLAAGKVLCSEKDNKIHKSFSNHLPLNISLTATMRRTEEHKDSRPDYTVYMHQCLQYMRTVRETNTVQHSIWFVCVCVAVPTRMHVAEVEREVQICTFMKLMLSDLWKNVCTELRSFSASCRFSLSCSTCWEFFLTYMVKVLSSICTVSAWFASSSACIL